MRSAPSSPVPGATNLAPAGVDGRPSTATVTRGPRDEQPSDSDLPGSAATGSQLTVPSAGERGCQDYPVAGRRSERIASSLCSDRLGISGVVARSMLNFRVFIMRLDMIEAVGSMTHSA